MHIVKNFLSNFKRNKACSFLSWQAHFVFFIEVSKNNDHVLVTFTEKTEGNDDIVDKLYPYHLTEKYTTLDLN